MKYIFALLGSFFLFGCGPTVVVDHAEDGSTRLIRSPQPDEDDLKELHAKYNLSTIINLRGADVIGKPENGWPGWHVIEKDFCSKNHITYLVMDLNDGTAPPSDDDIALFLHIMNSKPFWPVLIHCQAGIHRTGFFAALYRIQFNNWDPERAIEEMEDYWFNWSISDRSRLKAYLRNYKRRELK